MLQLIKPESASTSEMDLSHQQGASLSLPEKVVHFINKFRFKSTAILQRLLRVLAADTNKENRTIQLSPQNRVIHYQEEAILDRLARYVSDIDVLNQILPDFTFSPKLQDFFMAKYGGHIRQNKGLFAGQPQEFIQRFQARFKASHFYGYYMEGVCLDDLEQLLVQILIDEFVILNKGQAQRQSENLLLEFSPDFAPEQLGLLSNIFNVICVCLQEKEPQEGKASAQTYDMYILLVYTEVEEGVESPVRNAMKRKTIECKKVVFAQNLAATERRKHAQSL